ncbi:hypothetical protein LUZ63_004178 [Rhynchospora breviuscula]|uniref:Ribosomal protein L1 n=1 Tax=Rhynchospora breviuscula TaxID=2022672 RepID=A0A9Q0HZE9_9POAL|nr:hypothetical protein LUZ63_004178 [Rhynchospora breviuscula]
MSPLPPEPAASASSAAPLETIDRAVGALLRWHRRHPAPPSDNFIYLILSLVTTPHNGRLLSFRFPLPHSLFSSICIFTNNPQIQTQPLDPSPTILSLADLRSLYSSRESLVDLSNSFDLFLADRKIAARLPSLLGDAFYSKKKKKRRSKEPVPINLSSPVWPDKAREILGSTRLEMEGGHCKGVRVGRVSMERKQVVENVAAAIEAAVRCVPKKWHNIRSIHIKSTESVALPIYKEGGEEDELDEVDLEEEKGSKKRKVLAEKLEGK